MGYVPFLERVSPGCLAEAVLLLNCTHVAGMLGPLCNMMGILRKTALVVPNVEVQISYSDSDVPELFVTIHLKRNKVNGLHLKFTPGRLYFTIAFMIPQTMKQLNA